MIFSRRYSLLIISPKCFLRILGFTYLEIHRSDRSDVTEQPNESSDCVSSNRRAVGVSKSPQRTGFSYMPGQRDYSVRALPMRHSRKS